MVEWRDRGFVQDSDEEEDLDSNDTQSAPRHDAITESLADIEAIDSNHDEGSTSQRILASQAARITDIEGESRTKDPHPESQPVENLSQAREVQSCATAKLPHDGSLEPLATAQQKPAANEPSQRQSSIRGDIPTSKSSKQTPLPLLHDRSTPAFDDQTDSGLSSQHSQLPPQAEGIQSVEVVVPQRPQGRSYAATPADATADLQGRNGRTLRKRNPIQLHPYLLEGEKYRQTLKSRGLQPVKVTLASSGRHHETQDSETQDQDFRSEEDSQFQIAQNEPSSSLARSSSASRTIPALTSSPPDFPVGEDEEFPDLDVILQREVIGGVQQGYKRRRTAQYTHKKGPLSTKERPGVVATVVTDRPAAAEESSIFDVPPSPPTTASTQSPPVPDKPRMPQFRMPRGVLPARLITPVTSSDTKDRFHRGIEDESDSDTVPRSAIRRRAHTARTQSVTVISSSEQSSSDSEDSVSSQLRRVQRKIKGVLPASWLKLDQQAQDQRTRRDNKLQQRRGSPDHAEPQRGVAKCIQATHRTGTPSTVGRDGNSALIISDDSDEQETGRPLQQAILDSDLHMNLSAERGENGPLADVDDLEEDDWIDPMLPSASRHRSAPQSTRKRQIKLADAFSLSNKRQRICANGQVSHARPQRRPHYIQKKSKRSRSGASKRSRAKMPHLGVLDVLPKSGSLEEPVPLFLRLAARQARRRPDKGRGSPTHKHIRLQTREDTEVANVPLREWHAGKLVQRELAPPMQTRYRFGESLSEQMGNSQRRLPPTVGREPSKSVAVGVASGSVHDKTAGQVTRATLRQGTLRPVVLEKPPESVRHSQDQGQPDRPVKTSRMNRVLPRKPTLHRGAQLECTEALVENGLRAVADNRGLRKPNLAFLDLLGGRINQPQLDRLLADEDEVAPIARPAKFAQPHSGQSSEVYYESTEKIVEQSRRRKPPPRKLPPRRLDVEVREYRQPSEPLPPVRAISIATPQLEGTFGQNLAGLGPFGTRYTTDFDVFPLALGTYFHQSTFIGSGEFEDSLTLKGRNLNLPAGTFTANGQGLHISWGPWTEDVGSELCSILKSTYLQWEAISSVSVEEQGARAHVAVMDIVNALRTMIRYLSGFLSFLDPIDRRSCVFKLSNAVDTAFDTTTATWTASDHSQAGPTLSSKTTRIVGLYLVLAYQILHTASHRTVDTASKSDAETLVRKIARPLIRICVRDGMIQIREFLEDNKRDQMRENGIRDDKPVVEGIILAFHILYRCGIAGTSFWDLVNQEVSVPFETLSHIQIFERIWYDVFILLPLLEIDSTGLLQVGQRFQMPMDNWPLVKSLLGRLLMLYAKTAETQSSTLNNYIRAVFSRCHRLIHGWGWRKSESVLSVLFDFFAYNGLAPLRNEEIHESPHFLETLHQEPSLEIQPQDKSFHIFVKLVGSGLRAMRQVYPDKRIQGIAWRFIPNHGRTYRKDEAVRQEDIDALRNHHDLLCTLYWASPPGFRPRVDLLRNLVDHTASHREACRLNVRAWANLAKYQVSVEEPSASLESFAIWFKEIVDHTISQYYHARTEAEAEFEAARARGDDTISSDLLRSTISNNQSQVLATLIDALAGMKAAIEAAKDKSAASALLQGSGVTEAFKLIDAKKPRQNAAIAVTVDVLQSYVKLFTGAESQKLLQESTEESQDYGDWPDLDVIGDAQCESSKPVMTPEHFEEPLAHLLSNCFGAEISPDDALLEKVVDTWTLFVSYLVGSGQRDWNNYLDSYSSTSWQQLRDTEQTRKYSTYFLCSILEVDSNSLKLHHEHFMSSWLLSLVERESMLKFQHKLTAALLNADPTDPLLQNLPFLRDLRTKRFNVSSLELRERRLSLISCILSNMRESFDDTMRNRPSEVLDRRREYTALLKQLMAAMKKNYLELQQGDTVKGAYVEFVQKVVEFLQQHTSDICAVDRFFTDSAAFPLPATDPTYVVGRLKGYAAKLRDIGTIKKLATFIQTVSERAALDSQQPYLVGQLYTAMSNAYERGGGYQPTLRSVLLQAIFPAYIELSFKSAAGWIIACPILQASTLTFRDLIFDFSVTDPSSNDSVTSMITSSLIVLQRTVELLVDHSGLLEQPHVLHVLAFVLQTVTTTIPIVDYIYCHTRLGQAAVQCIAFFESFTLFVAETVLAEYEDATAPYADEDLSLPFSPFADIRHSCARELNDTMSKSWSKHGAEYYVTRNGVRREVVVELGTIDDERSRVIRTIEEFHGMLERTGGFDRRAARKREALVVKDILI